MDKEAKFSHFIVSTEPTITNMKLRDYFAAKAMQSLTIQYFESAQTSDEIAEMAYTIADKMLKARGELS